MFRRALQNSARGFLRRLKVEVLMSGQATSQTFAIFALTLATRPMDLFVQRLDRQNLPHAFLLNGPEGLASF